MALTLFLLVQILNLVRYHWWRYWRECDHRDKLPGARMCFVVFSIYPIQKVKLNAQTQADFNNLLVGTSVASSSTLLMLRTIAVWNRSPFVMIPLALASLGHWLVLLHTVIYVRSSWSDALTTCVVDYASPVFIGVGFVYSK